MYSLPAVSPKAARRAKRWMSTPEYRDRVGKFRQRCEAGEAFTAEQVAELLRLPLGYVIAMMMKWLDKPGGVTFVPPKVPAWN